MAAPTLARIIHVRPYWEEGDDPDDESDWQAAIVTASYENHFWARVYHRHREDEDMSINLKVADEGKTWRWPPKV